MQQEQDWTEAYKELCAIIKPAIPAIKHIDLWYEQINYPKEEYPYPEECLFIDFNVNSIDTLGGNVQDLNVTFSFIHVFDTLSDTYNESTNQDIALSFMATQKKLHNLLQGLGGVNFSPMDRVSNKRIPTQEGYLNIREIGYNCIIREYCAAKEYTETTITSIGISNAVAPVNTWTDIYSPPTS
jgi:hypothetical protein